MPAIKCHDCKTSQMTATVKKQGSNYPEIYVKCYKCKDLRYALTYIDVVENLQDIARKRKKK